MKTTKQTIATKEDVMNKCVKVGQKVRTVEGNIETVMLVEEGRVITFESATRLTWYHPTKVAKVYTSRTERLARAAYPF